MWARKHLTVRDNLMHSLHKALIIGTGFGNLYKGIYESMGWQVTTVDIADPNADYDHIPLNESGMAHWDTCHICIPNHLHYEMSVVAGNFCDIVFIEKPGVGSADAYRKLCSLHPSTRFMMTKNNQYRDNIQEMSTAAHPSTGVTRIRWINTDRIPKPGSWFTTKAKAFGGVSRDLMPHLLSLYQMFEPDWRDSKPKWAKKEQRWTLDQVTESDYGNVVADGIYDVDDFCYIDFGDYQLEANWKSLEPNDIAVHTSHSGARTKVFELGLCPESAYQTMIETAVENLNNTEFWQLQTEMDLWIHQTLDNL